MTKETQEFKENIKAFIIRNGYHKVCNTTPEDLADYLEGCINVFIDLQLQEDYDNA